MDEQKIPRRSLPAAAGATAAMAAVSTGKSSTTDAASRFQIPTAIQDSEGIWYATIKIIAADDWSPVSGVSVTLNYWGTDGGFYRYETDADGIAKVKLGKSLSDINYWIYLSPPNGSRFAGTGEHFGDKSDTHFNLLSMRADGSYFPCTFRLKVHEPAPGHDKHMEYHTIDRDGPE